MPGGLFAIAPLALAAVAVPFLRRRARGAEGRGVWALSVSCLVLGLLLVVLDSRMAGWMALHHRFRMVVRFGRIAALSCMLDVARPRLRWLARAGFLALLLFMIVITLLIAVHAWTR